MFESSTPKNINNLTTKELLELIEPSDSDIILSINKRYKILRHIASTLNLTLSNDLSLLLLSEPKIKLCLSTAGGGKTTSALLQVILEKIYKKVDNPLANKFKNVPNKISISGNKILFLVYNRHNIYDVDKKHKKMLAKVRTSNIKGLNIDDELNIKTFHSFCEYWRNEYKIETSTFNFSTLNNIEAISYMQTSIKNSFKKNKMIGYEKVSVKDLLSLYNYMRESLMSFEDLTVTDKFLELNLPLEIIKDCFKFYNDAKNRCMKIDYTDMLFCIYNLLRTNKEILNRVQSFYDYIIADEVQDLTPIMLEILKLISGKAQLMCIGDEDQTIYSFRGADIESTLHFAEKFDNSKVYTLNKNRRCGRKILELAKPLIETNVMRYNKTIEIVKEDGNVETIPYTTTEGQVFNLLDKLKRIQKNEKKDLYDTVICARENEQLKLFTQVLLDNDIPIYSQGIFEPYSNFIYKDIFNILNCLENPYNPHYHIFLHMILPIRVDQYFEIIQYNPKKREYITENAGKPKHFIELLLNTISQISSLKDILDEVNYISDNIEVLPMNKYINRIFELYQMYYYNYNKKRNNNSVDEIYERLSINYFNSNLIFNKFKLQHRDRLNMINKNNEYKTGVAISTMHGLKGLEFKNVFVVSLDDEIFPNFKLIDSKNYSNKTKQLLKESETRLFYVTITRAKDNLYLYYNSKEPSYYITKIIDGTYAKMYQQGNLKEPDLSLVNEPILKEPTLKENFENVEVKDSLVNVKSEEKFEDVETEDNLMIVAFNNILKQFV